MDRNAIFGGLFFDSGFEFVGPLFWTPMGIQLVLFSLCFRCDHHRFIGKMDSSDSFEIHAINLILSF
jgi:hypothetical protein